MAGRQAKFDTFWDEAKKFIQEDVGVAVDDRRHSTVVHVAKVVSVRGTDKLASKHPTMTSPSLVSYLLWRCLLIYLMKSVGHGTMER